MDNIDRQYSYSGEYQGRIICRNQRNTYYCQTEIKQAMQNTPTVKMVYAQDAENA
ncbi:hypothetical protein AAEH84_09630 [Shewanella indica]|uniref:Uncharacterized protein n=1 Tax=Shewanella indica TaxID=768528 RepID=A0ABU4QB64_9GAMM|nr:MULTISPECIES: hypothetical protein [Shewanella]MCE9793331.1 hypothetical protein [Shewanella indica]MCL1161018.1 hypothetical protein [Shewanella chilikensis]MDX6016038.1 hypothetical protein [Shewanella indica]